MTTMEEKDARRRNDVAKVLKHVRKVKEASPQELLDLVNRGLRGNDRLSFFSHHWRTVISLAGLRGLEATGLGPHRKYALKKRRQP